MSEGSLSNSVRLNLSQADLSLPERSAISTPDRLNAVGGHGANSESGSLPDSTDSNSTFSSSINITKDAPLPDDITVSCVSENSETVPIALKFHPENDPRKQTVDSASCHLLSSRSASLSNDMPPFLPEYVLEVEDYLWEKFIARKADDAQ